MSAILDIQAGAADRRRQPVDFSAQPRVYPSQYTLALMLAAQAGDMRRVDEITDELVALGHCRPRTAVSPDWISNRSHHHEGQQ